MAIVALRVLDADPLPRLDRSEVPDDYSLYPPFIDDNGQKWAHVDSQAFDRHDRRIPVYDAVPDNWDG